MKIKAWLRSPLGIAIIAVALTPPITFIEDYIANKPFLTTIIKVSKKIWECTIYFLNFNIKVWWILVAIALIILILFVLSKFNRQEQALPSFYSFRENTFKKWKWSWDWKWNTTAKVWNISNLKAHCPLCNTPLVQRNTYFGLGFYCPRCDYQANEYNSEDPSNIERIIIDDIERRNKAISS